MSLSHFWCFTSWTQCDMPPTKPVTIVSMQQQKEVHNQILARMAGHSIIQVVPGSQATADQHTNFPTPPSTQSHTDYNTVAYFSCLHIYLDSQSLVYKLYDDFGSLTVQPDWDILQTICHKLHSIHPCPHLHFVRAHQETSMYDDTPLPV